MSHNLELLVDLREGALVRMLGLVERRGFLPLDIRTRPGRRPGTLAVSLRVGPKHAERSVHVLQRHLQKLYDVQEVLLPAESVPRVVGEPVPC